MLNNSISDQANIAQMNQIFISRQSKIILHRSKSVKPKLSHQILASALKNFENMGYTLSRQVQEVLSTYEKRKFLTFYNLLFETLKSEVGGNLDYKPMYPNFPKQVMEMEEVELYVNAILHYFGDWIGMRIIPHYEDEVRSPLLEKTELKVIGLGTEQEFHALFHNMLLSKTSISATDRADLKSYLTTFFKNLDEILPKEFNHKEILAFVGGLILRHSLSEGDSNTNEGKFPNTSKKFNDFLPYLLRQFKTPTDVLRLFTALSEGDISLAAPALYFSPPRRIRKILMGLLENFNGNIYEEMDRHATKWIRVGERLHPTEYREKFPRTCSAFDQLRNPAMRDKEARAMRFNSRVERYLEEYEIEAVLEILVTRPGVFGRRLDHLLRLASISEQTDDVIQKFTVIASSLSNPILLQLYSHFKHRNDGKELRIFFPKGQVSKVQAIPNDLDPLDPQICSKIVKICAQSLINKFRQFEPMTTVFLDEKLKQYIVPFSQRSASKSLRTVVRGSRIDWPPLGEYPDPTIRLFLWWKDVSALNRTDIDLTGVLFDKNWKYLEHISYTNLKSGKYKAAHSGDITSAPEGACEFIDLDIQSAQRYGARYAVMSVFSYTQHPFCNLPECFAGWMIRKQPNSGEIFEPRTIQDKLDLSANTKVCIPLVLDFREKQMIWADLALKNQPSFNNNIEAGLSSVALMGKSIENLIKPTLYELFLLHIQARSGQLVETPSKAETVFSLNQGVTPYDIEKIIGEFL